MFLHSLQGNWHQCTSKSPRDEARDSHSLNDELTHLFKVQRMHTPKLHYFCSHTFLYSQTSCQAVRTSACAWPFQEAVDINEVPDYYDVIKDPIGCPADETPHFHFHCNGVCYPNNMI